MRTWVSVLIGGGWESVCVGGGAGEKWALFFFSTSASFLSRFVSPAAGSDATGAGCVFGVFLPVRHEQVLVQVVTLECV